MNINSTGSSSSYVSSASSNKGFSGLMSGLDTESMVEAMLSGTQEKIDKQNALRQQMVWKQEIYRDIISSINVFQSKYFTSSGSVNLLSQAFYNSMNAVTSSSHFKVTATSSASIGNTSLSVQRLASNTKLTSGQSVSGRLMGKLDAAAFQDMVDQELGGERKVVFDVGGTKVSVDFTDVFVKDGTFTSLSENEKSKEIVSRINTALENAGLSGDVTAKLENGQLKITTTDPKKTIKLDEASTELGLSSLGFEANSRSVYNSDQTSQILSGKISAKSVYAFNLSLDDTQKTIEVDLSKIVGADGVTVSLDNLKQEMQDKIDLAHGKGQVNLVSGADGASFEFQVSAGRKVMVGGEQEALDVLGMKNGQSNKIGLGGELRDLYFANALQGSRYEFSINGQEFLFSESDTIGEIITAINSSDAGVRVVYKPLEDKFVMESLSSGAGHEIVLEQKEGNLLNAMFGSGVDGNLKAGSSVSSRVFTQEQISASPVLSDDDFEVKEGQFVINVNGKNYTFSIPKKTDTDADGNTSDHVYTKDEIIAELKTQMDNEFGGDVTMNSDGSLRIAQGMTVKIAKSEISDPFDPEIVKKAAQSGDLNLAFGYGLGGADNAVTEEMTLADIGLSGLVTTGDMDNTKLGDLESLGLGLSFADGRITLTGSGAAVSVGSPDVMEKLFGAASVALDAVPAGADGSALAQGEYAKGENALVEIDGVLTERSSNTFSVNGLNIELTGVSEETSPGVFQSETIGVSRGTDQIVDGIKEFIKDYNELIEKLNGLVDEDASYQEYAPLTDAQKKEMTDKEIELWEEKAKEGLLRRDSTIDGFLQAMRTALYEKPDGSLYAIYNLGIETSDAWEDKGKLVMDSDGEARLRQVIESDPDAVLKLFTDPEQGLAVKLNKILDETANLSSANPGSLVQIAGVKGRASDTQNDIYKRLKEIDEKISALKRTYEKEKERYWRQFNTMESALASLNTQSNWLAQQLGSL